MRIYPVFAWYDMWVGAYWDRKGRRLYLLPLPCLGVVLDFGGRCRNCLGSGRVGAGFECPLCCGSGNAP